jgi:flagellar export protein FliJ
MKKFKFKLQKLLDIRLVEEDKIKHELGKVVGEQNKLRVKQQKYLDETSQEKSKFHEKMKKGEFKFNELKIFSNFTDFAEKVIKNSQVEIDNMEPAVNEVRQRLIEATKQRKIIDKLKDKQYKEWEYDITLNEGIKMINDMHAVMQRINDIKKRFGITKRVDNSQKKSANFDQKLQESIKVESYNEKKSSVKLNKKEIDFLADKIAKREGVSTSLVKSIISTESSYNQNAISKKGAMGLMQLMPETARQLGVGNPFSPEENITGGVKLIKQLLSKHNGDYKNALAAYNAGDRAVNRHGGVPPYKETKEFVNKVINSYLKHK